MIEWLTSKGWQVEVMPGFILVTKGASTGHYSTVRAAYAALGGPKQSNLIPGAK